MCVDGAEEGYGCEGVTVTPETGFSVVAALLLFFGIFRHQDRP